MLLPSQSLFLFFFNDTATTEIYTLSLHDALPISSAARAGLITYRPGVPNPDCFRCRSTLLHLRSRRGQRSPSSRSEEHTSEIQSHLNLVCRLLLEKKKKDPQPRFHPAVRIPPTCS